MIHYFNFSFMTML